MNWRGARDPGTRAERLRVRPWTDPRVLLGVLLVLAATVLGARFAAAADDTVQYWAVSEDVQAGDPVSSDQLVPASVRLDDETAARYLAVDADLPGPIEDLVWSYDLSGDALVERDALGAAVRADVRQVPLLVADGAAPTDLARGDLVEVWVGPGPGDDVSTPAVRVLASAAVLRASSGESSLDGGGARTVLVEVATSALTGEAVGALSAGHVTLVRLP